MKRIAVEDSLSGVKELLRANGYQVLDPSAAALADAVVVTGLDNNTMNMQEIGTAAAVIEAAGKTPQEVLERIRRQESR